jgi:hypothetical protein
MQEACYRHGDGGEFTIVGSTADSRNGRLWNAPQRKDHLFGRTSLALYQKERHAKILPIRTIIGIEDMQPVIALSGK